MAERVVSMDMDSPPYQLVFGDETLTIKDRIVVPAGETEIETPFAEEDLDSLVIHQTITEEAMITLASSTYRLYRSAGVWTLTEVEE
jgi:hypothetical protein